MKCHLETLIRNKDGTEGSPKYSTENFKFYKIYNASAYKNL